MAQSTFDSSTLLPTMASSLASIITADICVQEVGSLSDNSSLLAPLHNGSKIVLDLTPGEDDWLEVLACNSDAFQHHESEATKALHLAVRLTEADSAKLDAIEKQVQKVMNYRVIGGKTWFGMHRGDGKIILNLVVGDSVALTPLRFLQGGAFKKGAGQDFLNKCLEGSGLKDFCCKVKVELECVQQANDAISILLTVHSVIFVPVPKRSIVDYTVDEEEAVIRAAKRLKYRF